MEGRGQFFWRKRNSFFSLLVGINRITTRCLTENDGAFDLLQLERTWTDVQCVISWKRNFLRHHIEPRASDPGKISLIKFVYRTRFWYSSLRWYCWSGGGKGIWPGKKMFHQQSRKGLPSMEEPSRIRPDLLLALILQLLHLAFVELTYFSRG